MILQSSAETITLGSSSSFLLSLSLSLLFYEKIRHLDIYLLITPEKNGRIVYHRDFSKKSVTLDHHEWDREFSLSLCLSLVMSRDFLKISFFSPKQTIPEDRSEGFPIVKSECVVLTSRPKNLSLADFLSEFKDQHTHTHTHALFNIVTNRTLIKYKHTHTHRTLDCTEESTIPKNSATRNVSRSMFDTRI